VWNLVSDCGGNNVYWNYLKNIVLRKIFAPEVVSKRGRRKSHNKEFNNFYPSRNIIKVILWMKWGTYVAHMWEVRNACRTLTENCQRKRHMQQLGVYGRIIMKWFFKKYGARLVIRLNWLRMRSSDVLLWTGRWRLIFHKRWKCLDLKRKSYTLLIFSKVVSVLTNNTGNVSLN